MIEFLNTTKKYGKTLAVDNLNCMIKEKKIYCLLGRNGAGKTTLMNLISGKISASDGMVLVNGKKVSTLQMPENVKYIEAAQRQFNMKIEDLIKMARGLEPNFDYGFAMEMVERFHLEKNKKYNRLSFGMKTMVTTLISLSSNQDVVLLDEPVLGFDAITRQQFYSLLQESFAYMPRIIIISTHLIDEITKVAEQIMIIDQGKLILNESTNTILEKAYKVTGQINEVVDSTKQLNVFCREKIGKYQNAYVYDQRIAATGNLEIENLPLQDLFVKMIGGNEDE